MLFIATVGRGADLNYPISLIPDELKQNVSAVVREDHATFQIISRSQAVHKAKYVITILNSGGKKYAVQVLGYDKLTRITSFKANVYDGLGKQIKKLKSSEIYDQSAFDDYTLYSDNRIKVADLSQTVYPYTVEFEYEIEYKFLFYIPTSVAIQHEKVSVQNYSYTLIYPSQMPLRYEAKNFDRAPKEQKLPDGTVSISWDAQNLTPIKHEPHGPSLIEIIPNVKAAPTVFEFDGYAGEMKSWNEFGVWINQLNSGRGKLPEATKKEAEQIAARYQSREEKVKALYEFMQSKTRYVSVQLGIGGFQPFDAATVNQTGYGDCKALSNYMVALLGAVDIPANYTLIKAGENASSLNKDFPSSQFNHVVVSVPNGSDTLWLECTSQKNPFGYMGRFTGDREALAITPKGAAIVHTPIYTKEVNRQLRVAKVVLNQNGDATATVSTQYEGLQYENDNLDSFLDDQRDQQEKWIRQHTDIPAFDLVSFEMQNQKHKIPAARVAMDLRLPRYASVSGKRMFLSPNLMNKSKYIPERVENRKSKVIRSFAFTDVDSIHFEIPEILYPEFLPEAIEFKSRFGAYSAKVTLDERGLVYVRRLEMQKGEFPAESYDELIDFLKNVSKADNLKLVFLNKT